MKKVVLILLISAITFLGGSLIAYYNTTKTIYDDVTLFNSYSDGFKIMDFRFTYN